MWSLRDALWTMIRREKVGRRQVVAQKALFVRTGSNLQNSMEPQVYYEAFSNEGTVIGYCAQVLHKHFITL